MRFAALSLTALALSACVPSIIVGDAQQGESATDEPVLTTGDPAGGEMPTGSTTGAPLPAVCGDGVVGDGEACDDGNDEPNDGCDADCTVTGTVVWTRQGKGQLTDLAAAPDGTIYICTTGVFEELSKLRAFAPDGAELWTIDLPDRGPITVATGGQIVLTTPHSGIHRFAPDGTELGSWTPPEEFIIDIAAAGDGLFAISGSNAVEGQMLVRRHDLETGEIVWETATAEGPIVSPAEVVVVGERVLVPGHLFDEERRPMLAAFATDTGAALSLALDDPLNPAWKSVASLGDGGLALAGQIVEPGAHIVRRVTADQQAAWTELTLDTAMQRLRPEQLAAGAGGHVAVVGADARDNWTATVHLFDGEGEVRWTSRFSDPSEDKLGEALAATFGADYLVVGGHVLTRLDHDDNNQWWVRRFAVD
ncbi:outer membrane protein assembly factor BamB family protein [Nannocystis bainbridge]|uniref:PQQ-binding-like beta-propeller repeat protein n=1 Tax=Nannocystis bainbridge TaxID=2995303 RepID=A0ABT5DT11_9BACT|nr:PQQ-binding-like beta-propeller repeat protein [Nannocystis bainbridge]MDC0716768.1 PQQ-binding-like beta-propeller repeat protein [Nannocystis bainbridge]